MTLFIKPNQMPATWQFALRRIAAYFIDTTLLMIIVQAVQWGVSATTGGFPFNYLVASNNGWLIYGWVLLTVSLPVWLYFVLFERSPQQATLGKRWLGLKVVKEDGQMAHSGQLLSRTILKLLPWGDIPMWTFMLPTPLMSDPTAAFRPGFIIGFVIMGLYMLMLLNTPRQQSIHDLIAKTVVINR